MKILALYFHPRNGAQALELANRIRVENPSHSVTLTDAFQVRGPNDCAAVDAIFLDTELADAKRDLVVQLHKGWEGVRGALHAPGRGTLCTSNLARRSRR